MPSGCGASSAGVLDLGPRGAFAVLVAGFGAMLAGVGVLEGPWDPVPLPLIFKLIRTIGFLVAGGSGAGGGRLVCWYTGTGAALKV